MCDKGGCVSVARQHLYSNQSYVFRPLFVSSQSSHAVSPSVRICALADIERSLKVGRCLTAIVVSRR